MTIAWWPADKHFSGGRCLEYPVFMALQPEAGTLLVSEPAKNRIGIYDSSSLQFKVIVGRFDMNVIRVGGSYIILLDPGP